MARIPPAEQLGQLAEQLAMGARQGTEAEDLTSTLVRLGARKLIEAAGSGSVEHPGILKPARRRSLHIVNGEMMLGLPQVRCYWSAWIIWQPSLPPHRPIARNLRLNSSIPARPYICRFSSFNLLM